MISIHQSQFLPWVPYFFKIVASDIFIILDDVQYQKNGVQNRNQIKTPQGASYITVPVNRNLHTKINEVSVAREFHIKKLLASIAINYKRAVFFEQVFTKLETVFYQFKGGKLFDLNKIILQVMLEILEVKTVIKYSSSFAISDNKDEMLLKLILANGEKQYISGQGGLNYMNLDKFKNYGIEVYLYDFYYSVYPQLWEKQGFIPNLSILDLVFNYLDHALQYIQENSSLKQIV